MSFQKPPYPPEFRQQIVELALAGRSPVELAREFGCSVQSIHKWMAKADSDHPSSEPAGSDLNRGEREELSRLRRENRQLKVERDILSKATAWLGVAAHLCRK